MSSNGLAVIPGNTMPGITKDKRKKAKNFQLTLNCENDNVENSEKLLMEKYEKLIEYLQSLKYIYIIACKEKNKKGFYHIHIFIQFETYRALSIKKCQGAHIEHCRGSIYDNINYIKKEGDILLEKGTPNIIRNSMSIRQALNLKNTDELLDFDIKYINCINTIKNTSLTWTQPTFNCSKKIDRMKFDDFNEDTANEFKDYKIASINFNKKQFNELFPNIIIDVSLYDNEEEDQFIMEQNTVKLACIAYLLNELNYKLNKPLQTKYGTYYANDVKSILILTS